MRATGLYDGPVGVQRRDDVLATRTDEAVLRPRPEEAPFGCLSDRRGGDPHAGVDHAQGSQPRPGAHAARAEAGADARTGTAGPPVAGVMPLAAADAETAQPVV